MISSPHPAPKRSSEPQPRPGSSADVRGELGEGSGRDSGHDSGDNSGERSQREFDPDAPRKARTEPSARAGASDASRLGADPGRGDSAVHLSIVIPAFNEAKRIRRTLELLSETLSPYPFRSEVLVVDDGSTDDTATVAESTAAEVPIRVLRERHLGKGGAVRVGMLRAAGTYRMLFDADASMPPSEIERFLEIADGGVEVVIGSREVAGARRSGESGLRNFRGRLFNAWVRMWAVPGIVDTQCGFKLFRNDAAEVVFGNLRSDGFAFDVEALLIARRAGCQIHEIPIEWVHDENSTLRPILDSVAMAFSVLGIRLRHVGRSYQLHGAQRSH